MTIQRRYSLPNCTLLIEGLNDGSARPTEVRPLLSMLVNAECHFTNSNQPPLTGGRDFFESLVTAVSAYAQEVLSNVHHPEAHKNHPGAVQLHKIAQNKHRLIVAADSKQGAEVDAANAHHAGVVNSAASPIALDLTTVQLFDLVEAVDQFFADHQTLPDLSRKLAPVSKRYTVSSQPLVKQAVPAAVGVSGLAIAAIAFFLMPVPQPQEPKPVSSTQSLPAKGSNNLVSSTPPAAPEITDPAQINALQQQLYSQINSAWQTRANIQQDLIYRVVVAADGAIVGYKSVSATANDGIEQTPLPDLLKNPAASPTGSQQAIAQYRVVFAQNKQLQVSPWSSTSD
jgi:hypothetical protein